MENNNKKEEKKISEKFWKFVLVVVVVIGHYIGYYSVSSVSDMKSEKTYCGIIAYKSSEEVPIKHGTSTELYLGIDFEEIGRKAIEVDVDTYFSSKKGDTVCFSLDKRQAGIYHTTAMREIFIFLSFIVGLFAIIVDIVFLVMFGDKIIKRFNNYLDGKQH